MPFKLNKIAPMFPSPLAMFEVANADKLNKTLLAEIAKRRAKEPSVQRSNRLGWHSETDLFQRKEPGHRALATDIAKMVEEATRQVSPGFDMKRIEPMLEGWININPAHAYNTPHDHHGAFWSGCYYVHIPDAHDERPDNGAIEFIDKKGADRYTKMIPSAMTADKVSVRPRAGMCLLFPGHVRHWVHPHDAAEERVTIAFNVLYKQRAA